MSWQIKVWHEESGESTRLCIEAGDQVPDDVISAVAGSYWLEEVQYSDEAVWEDDEGFIEESEGGPGNYHG